MTDSTTEELVLATGATGTVGSAVVDALGERGVTARAGVRDVAAAREQLGPGPEYVAFDFAKPETWGVALDGVDRLFLMRPPQVSVADVLAVADAAIRVGVEHVVALSVLGAEKNPLLPHRRIERHLDAADVAWTFLRASFFMQNLTEVHSTDIADHDEIFVPAGSGRTSFVDARDVGSVAATALDDPASHAGRAYDLTGPAALDYHEVAAILSDALDRPITYADPSVFAFVRRMVARGEPLPFVLVMVGIYTTARLGFAGRVADDVQRVLGRPPRSLRAFVEDNRAAFAPGT